MTGWLVLVVVLSATSTGCVTTPRAQSTTAPSHPSVAAPDATFVASASDFAVIAESGQDDRLLAWPLRGGIPAMMTFSAPASRSVVVTSLGPDGQQQDLLVSGQGPYTGTTLVGLRATPATIRITAQGAWRLTLAPLATAPSWDHQEKFTRNGDAVLVLQPVPTDPLVIQVTSSSAQIFALEASTPSSDALLVDEVGEFRGTVSIPADSVLLSVHTDGLWALEPP